MFEFVRVRIRQGTRTVPFPGGAADLPDRFRGLPVLDADGGGPARAVPSAILTTTTQGRDAIDVGACLFSPEEAGSSPEGTIRYTKDYRMACSTREGLVVPAGDEPELAAALSAASLRLFGRSLRLRSVVAGSCGGCEAELVALGNVVFDLARFGVQFVASPRHADGIVITGALSRNMRFALTDTWEATPPPRLVIAVGACAIAGGPFQGSPEVGHEALPGIPVDLRVPGCPPHPLTLLDGLLRLLGRLPAERRPGPEGGVAQDPANGFAQGIRSQVR
jgi:Ni,Fe-hydrogenase III small subunit